MQASKINRIVIVGGGTAGWMTAAALSRFLPPSFCSINLVESEQIGTVGVGEATIPHIRHFNAMLGIDEQEFIKETQATYKLGIQFNDWKTLGQSYMHPFGLFGHDINGIEFQHYWLRMRAAGDSTPFDQYSLSITAALEERFAYPSERFGALSSEYGYAFHLDASLYARYLRNYALNNGVKRTEGKVTHVPTNPDTGFIEAVYLESGEQLPGDLFIDCSGFRGLLIEKALRTGYENWTHWLPCDRAVAVPSNSAHPPSPYTQATARSAGWQWRIPLQHRTGNGLVYCSEYQDDERAYAQLSESLHEATTAEPNFLRFTTGRRKKSWNKNCVAIGLSSGFLEPLESTSIYLIQQSILKLLEFFPDQRCAPINTDEFNRQISTEYERIRDFLILHYHATQRNDSEFWNYCRNMTIPESLSRKITLFKETGHIEQYQMGLFMTPSWLAVCLGQGVVPNRYDHRVDSYGSNEVLAKYLAGLRQEIKQITQKMPSHQAFLEHSKKLGRQQQPPKASLSLYGSAR